MPGSALPETTPLTSARLFFFFFTRGRNLRLETDGLVLRAAARVSLTLVGPQKRFLFQPQPQKQRWGCWHERLRESLVAATKAKAGRQQEAGEPGDSRQMLHEDSDILGAWRGDI